MEPTAEEIARREQEFQDNRGNEPYEVTRPHPETQEMEVGYILPRDSRTVVVSQEVSYTYISTTAVFRDWKAV